MSIRLIGVMGRAHVLHRHVRVVHAVEALVSERMRHRRVVVGGLLAPRLLSVAASSGAAADADHPEQGGAPGEGNGEPGDRIHVPA